MDNHALRDHGAFTIDFPNRTQKPRYFLGGQDRLATMTDVCLLSEHRMIAVHLCGAAMFLLVRADKAAPWRIIDQIDTTFGEQLTIVDLIDVGAQGLIVASNFDACSGGLYRVVGNKLSHVRDLPLPTGAGNCHGARFVTEAMVCLSTNRHKLFFRDIDTDHIHSELAFPYHVKDLVFTDPTHALVACALGNPTPAIANAYASCIAWVEFDAGYQRFRVRDKRFLKPAAFDAIALAPDTNRFFITDQHLDRVIAGSLTDNKIRLDGQWSGFSFIHGVDYLEGTIAITTYGAHTIEHFDARSPLQPLKGYSGRLRPPAIQQRLHLAGNVARYYAGRIKARLPGLS